ncbi:BspA family leucine-rich repeat surface protein, partial [Ralstonia pseudosolanacearum]
GCSKLVNLHGLENHDVSSVEDMSTMLKDCSRLSSLVALTNWNAKPKSLNQFCTNTNINSLDGLENLDVSICTNFASAFQGNYYLTDCDAVSGWNVSSGTNFSYMLQGAYWLTSLSAFGNWNFGGNCGAMFYIASVMNVNDVVFDLSRVTNPTQMFYAIEKDYSSKLGKDLIKTGT